MGKRTWKDAAADIEWFWFQEVKNYMQGFYSLLPTKGFDHCFKTLIVTKPIYIGVNIKFQDFKKIFLKKSEEQIETISH